MDWKQQASWPEGQFDVLLGCDLIYDIELVPALLDIVCSLLRPGGHLLYCAGGQR